MLILLGGRDYQVTSVDFERWENAFTSSRIVTTKLYPTLNHLFIAGQQRSTPAEYARAGRMDDSVIRDIADWILAVQPGNRVIRR